MSDFPQLPLSLDLQAHLIIMMALESCPYVSIPRILCNVLYLMLTGMLEIM